MLKIAIFEDDSVHTLILKDKLKASVQIPCELTVFASMEDFKASFAEENSYDIVFMDIELEHEKENGIQIAHAINQLSPDTQIIFISQYLEYVSNVYETEHIYFINKEQMDTYLPKALDAAIKKLALLKHQYLTFSQKKQLCRIRQNDILYMERNLRTTSVYTRSREEPYTTSLSLQVLKEQLSSCFLLCHRSFLVNLKAVSTFNREEITLFNGCTIPMGRTHYEEFKKAFARTAIDPNS